MLPPTETGSTVTVAVMGVPEQPLAVGVIVKVTVIGALVVLTKEPLMPPLPLAAMPVTVAVLSLVQSYTVPLTLPLNPMAVMAEDEQMVWLEGIATALGVGLKVMTTSSTEVPQGLLSTVQRRV